MHGVRLLHGRSANGSRPAWRCPCRNVARRLLSMMIL
jgi:hypothetical protein